jgi:hypothetical protein
MKVLWNTDRRMQRSRAVPRLLSASCMLQCVPRADVKYMIWMRSSVSLKPITDRGWPVGACCRGYPCSTKRMRRSEPGFSPLLIR